MSKTKVNFNCVSIVIMTIAPLLVSTGLRHKKMLNLCFSIVIMTIAPLLVSTGLRNK